MKFKAKGFLVPAARIAVFLFGINGFWVAHVDRLAIWLGIVLGVVSALDYELRVKSKAT